MSSKWNDKEFVREYNLEYQRKNKEKIKKQNKEYRSRSEVKNHKQEYDKIYSNLKHIKLRKKEQRRRYYLKNREMHLQQTNEYKLKNKDRIRDHNHKYNQRDYVKKRDNENRKKKKLSDINYKLRCMFRSRLWNVLDKYSKTGKIMSSKKYGINYKKIIEHLKPFPKDIEKYHVDHIIPLSYFDFNNPKEIAWAFAPENHQWLIKEENLKKGNRFIG